MIRQEMTSTLPHKIYEVVGDTVKLRLHRGQTKTWDSAARFTWMIAGTQSGKTAFGPWWLNREIGLRGGGDYLAVTSTYDLFKLKMLPEIRNVFEHILGIARYWSGDRVLELCDPETGKFRAKRADDPMWGRIILRSAQSLAGLESATAKAAWLDEVGQDEFSLAAWEAVRRRIALNIGRVLGSTTPYSLGWLKQQVFDRWKSGDPDHNVISFPSIQNPAFPVEEFESARRSMPAWRFNMFYRGLFERPVGLIYDSFDESNHKTRRFTIPADWKRYMGLDFGGVNTTALFYAKEPDTPRYFLYREYKAGRRTAAQHAKAILTGEPMLPYAVGGSLSEGQWRDEFAAGGLPIHEPDIGEVEVGIDRVWGAHNTDAIMVFDDLNGYLDEKLTYSRKLDANDGMTEEIENKSSYHYMDAERYLMTHLFTTEEPFTVGRKQYA